MSRPEIKVGDKTDVNTNSLSFKDNARRLTTEHGEYVLSPSEVILDRNTGEITSYATIAITEQNYKDRKRKEYLQNKQRMRNIENMAHSCFLYFQDLKNYSPI